MVTPDRVGTKCDLKILDGIFFNVSGSRRAQPTGGTFNPFTVTSQKPFYVVDRNLKRAKHSYICESEAVESNETSSLENLTPAENITKNFTNFQNNTNNFTNFQNNTALYAGLSVGLAAFCILIFISTVLFYKRRKKLSKNGSSKPKSSFDVKWSNNHLDEKK